jgi:hypothetical protein
MVRDVKRPHQSLAARSMQCITGSGNGLVALQGAPQGVSRLHLSPPRLRRHLTWIAMISLMIANNAGHAEDAPQPGGKLHYDAKRGEPLTLIDGSDPKFMAELDANFPGVVNMASIETALPYMVILRNDTAKTVRAYEIRWEDAQAGLDESAPIEVLKTTAVTTPLELRWPAGNKLEDKSIRPGEERLVTPWSNVRRDELSFFDPSFGQSLRPAAMRQGLKAHVDCVVYGDGSFNGPNQSRLLLTYFITRDAQHDEALTILRRLRLNPADPALKQQLARRTDIGGSPSFSGNRAMAVYKHARAVAAQEFAQILQDSRFQAVKAMTDELVSTMPPYEEFTRLAEPYRRAEFTIGEVKVRAEE